MYNTEKAGTREQTAFLLFLRIDKRISRKPAMKNRLTNRLIVVVLVMMLASGTSFAGTGSAGDVAGKLQKELKAHGNYDESQQEKPKKTWEGAQTNLDAQAAKVSAAQKAYDDALATKNKGSLGFFEHEGTLNE